ncbi:MAG: sugar ABC transporter substrate-binding protein [Lachnospiraceae bacterium]|nr:sugar ABC transporter substrate-binding protein [Lachnospiraceae bacterium]MDD6448583.1 sugar ABC transporter substrate-binding protein [Lachnospiraceae bacterium]MDD6450713.1 sugar ABC transporter substrate-binding protein [Lachnospiraceae bacterium]MDD6578455.1 sugar ABC transporter substrate-binding protein [Lachnospiraceae bacterium]
MKKKVLSIMLVGVLAVGALAGCGSSSKSKSGSKKSSGKNITASEDKNTLSVYAWDKNFNIPALKAAEAAYQKKNPDFKLNIIEQSASSDVETAVTTAGSSKDYSALPDIVLFQDHYIQRYVHDYPDAWQNVDDAKVDWTQFSQDKIGMSTIGGKHYGFPVDNGTVIMAYRTDYLQQAGHSVDEMTGISWADFEKVAKDVKDKTGKYMMSMDHSGDDFPYMMLQAEGVSQFKDGKPQLTSEPKVAQVVDVIASMAKDETILLANSWDEYTASIANDQVAGVFNGNWIIATMKQNKAAAGKWAITTIPTLEGNGQQGYAANGGSSLYITAACKKADLAKDFLSYTFGGGDGAIETYDNALKNGGVISTYLPAVQGDTYQQADDFFGGAKVYATLMEYSGKVPAVEQNDFHYEARTDMGEAITNVINGTATKDALKDAQDKLEFAMEDNSSK